MRSPFAAVVLLASCGSPNVADAPCPDGGVRLTQLQARVFDHCGGSAYGAGCHARDPFGANMDLTSGHAWRNLVHAISQSSPTKFRVEPHDLANSFLWQKLNDQLATDGSEGLPMPRDPSDHWAELSPDDRTAVRCWIEAGANND
jgi:hypothetical protein